MISPIAAVRSLAQNSTTASAKLLYERREEILTQWILRVKREVRLANELQNPVVTNTIPLFLTGLAEALCEETTSETATESSNVAQEHGGERARVTKYGPEQILQEYQILRDVIRSKLSESVVLTSRDETIIQKSFDRAIQESMIAFFLVHSRIREQFVATLSHDLRNPIGVVDMASSLILEEVAGGFSSTSAGEIAELGRRIQKSARRADRMIQDLLDASVVQLGELPAIKLAEGDLRSVVEEVVDSLDPDERARLKMDLVDARGVWDLDALQRAIENLISNAFKYGDAGTVVTVVLRRQHERTMVSVHNIGKAIPAPELETLFQVFRRAAAAREGDKKGWGIGLSMARTVAERMGGSLAVESSSERGTTFTIDIPPDARLFADLPICR